MKLKEILAALACVAMICAATGCDDAPVVKPDYSVITFENAELDSNGILREQTLIGADEYEMGNFWQAYTEKGIGFRNFVATIYAFWCGVEISGHHEMTTASLDNEPSVYNTKGKSGSKFALCYDGGAFMGDAYKCEIYVTDSTNRVFDHVYITNSTWAALSMMNEEADALAKKFTYEAKDWFKLKITGIDSRGIEKDSTFFYLADFRTSTSGGVVTEWTKVDLTSLGAVQKLQFTLSSTDNNSYGMLTPAYFCMDDLAVKN